MKQKLLLLLLASLFFTGMQAQNPEPLQLRDTTFECTYYDEARTNNWIKETITPLYCTLSDGTKLFFKDDKSNENNKSGYFYLTLDRIESDQSTLDIPADYVYRGYRTPLKRVAAPTWQYSADFQEITVPEGTEVFYLPTANALTKLTLPSTIVCFDFTFSDKFKDLYLHSVYPPYWGLMDYEKGLNKPMSQSLENVTLHVPAMAMDLYARTEPYKNANLVALEEPVSHVFVGWRPDITIQNTEGLADDARLTIPRFYVMSNAVASPGNYFSAFFHNDEWNFEEYYNGGYNVLTYTDPIVLTENGTYSYPSVYTGGVYPAQLTMDAGKPVALRKFRLEQDCNQYWFDKYEDPVNNIKYKITPSTAIFNSPVTAEEIEMTYHLVMSKMRWKGEYMNKTKETGTTKYHLVSFPFDVRLSDITYPPLQDKYGMGVICMEFDGEKRATVASDGYWRELSKDEVLHANQGYLIEFFGRRNQTTLQVKAMETENKQQIFTNGDVSVPLTAHPSNFKHREGWNLIGNPYPCIFDIRHLDYTAPITVYDGFNYYAFSPVDDDYYLYPNEAFFVQCPEGVTSVTFKKEGRLHNDPNGLWLFNAPQSKRPSAHQASESGAVRRVYNFLLNGEDGYDRTRVVINEEASTDYELEHDAAKMMGQGGPQMYVLDNGVQYAIDERPLEDGAFTLGMVFPAKGSYVLSLKDNPDGQTPVILTDLLTGTETDLTQSAYTFDAAAGNATDRFSVRIGAKMPTPVQSISETFGEPVYYDLQGRIVTEPSAMQKGVYILKQGQTTRKIVK